MSSASDFGRDHGFIHEAVITGRKAGWGADDWAKLAHDESLMREVRKVLLGTASIQSLVPAQPTAVAELVVKKPARLIFLNSVSLPAMMEKETSACLEGDHFGYRDPDIDSWLPKMQPASAAGTAVGYGLGEELTFAGMCRAALKIADDAPLDEVERLLKERKHVLTLQQLDDMIERQEKFVNSRNNPQPGEDVGLRTDGLANFFPVLDKDGKVCVARVPRDGKWHRFVRRLGNDYVWTRGRRLFLGNSDASNL